MKGQQMQGSEEIRVDHVPSSPEEVLVWNRKRAGRNFRIHFHSSGSNLSGKNISRINLRRVDLSGSNLRGTILTGADLSWANLMGSDFTGARLEGANLSYANLRGANFLNANLARANLLGADIADTNFRGATLSYSNFQKVNNLDWRNLAGATITGSSLKLPGALKDAQGESLKTSDFKGVKLVIPKASGQSVRPQSPPAFPPEIDAFIKWVDYCLHPASTVPKDVFRPVTNDRKVLAQSINEMVSELKKQVPAPPFLRPVLKLLSKRLKKIQRPSVTGPAVILKRVDWELLPPGEMKPHLFKYLEHSVRAWKTGRIDLERIEKIINLNPSQIFVGKNQFSGYVVFRFDSRPIAVLDHPVIGNALYILDGDWEALSRLTKGELLESYSQKVRRIIHKKTWLDRLREELWMTPAIRAE